MSAETVSRWSRRFVLTGALFFVARALAALLGTCGYAYLVAAAVSAR